MTYENRRMLDIMYDEQRFDKYKKCDYCYKVIIGKEYYLKQAIGGITYFWFFCSYEHKKHWLLDKSTEKLKKTNL